ncbi:MAG TPA: hypothetical protein VH370_22900 [Humisphaera sp.]|jgi:hypothetical protein|nr:hypothetical protein [Humisphaera sp.]
MEDFESPLLSSMARHFLVRMSHVAGASEAIAFYVQRNDGDPDGVNLQVLSHVRPGKNEQASVVDEAVRRFKAFARPCVLRRTNGLTEAFRYPEGDASLYALVLPFCDEETIPFVFCFIVRAQDREEARRALSRLRGFEVTAAAGYDSDGKIAKISQLEKSEMGNASSTENPDRRRKGDGGEKGDEWGKGGLLLHRTGCSKGTGPLGVRRLTSTRHLIRLARRRHQQQSEKGGTETGTGAETGTCTY